MIVYTAGVWDLFHTGHLRILERSKELAGEGGKLVVGVVTDLGAAAYKPTPPINSEHARLEIVDSIEIVDAVFLQPGTDPSPVLVALARVGARPDLMTHGDDWEHLRIGQETLERLGIDWKLLPYTPDVSTTEIRRRVMELGG